MQKPVDIRWETPAYAVDARAIRPKTAPASAKKINTRRGVPQYIGKVGRLAVC